MPARKTGPTFFGGSSLEILAPAIARNGPGTPGELVPALYPVGTGVIHRFAGPGVVIVERPYVSTNLVRVRFTDLVRLAAAGFAGNDVCVDEKLLRPA